jgi:hypothetical protein
MPDNSSNLNINYSKKIIDREKNKTYFRTIRLAKWKKTGESGEFRATFRRTTRTSSDVDGWWLIKSCKSPRSSKLYIVVPSNATSLNIVYNRKQNFYKTKRINWKFYTRCWLIISRRKRLFSTSGVNSIWYWNNSHWGLVNILI